MLRFNDTYRIGSIHATIRMNRLIFSAIGVILTFIWIVYSAPHKQDKLETFEDGPIKTISKSGSTSLNKISQPIKSIESEKLKAREYQYRLKSIN